MTAPNRTETQASPVVKALTDVLRATVEPEHWMDWRWQLRHAFENPYEICDILGLEKPQGDLQIVIDEFVVRVTPYYLNMLCLAVDTYGREEIQKVARTFLPSPHEAEGGGISEVDGMGEEGTHPRRVISMLYPDRALLFVTNVCPIYCRYCFRKRKVGRVGEPGVPSSELDEAIVDIERQTSVRDVIISGGEPLMLNDDALVDIVQRVASIGHVGIIRIDTKFLTAFPPRLSDELAERLAVASDGKVLHFTFHFVHPMEITDDVKARTWSFARYGIQMHSYIPLLRGVNDDRIVLKDLFWKLVLAKIHPYYLVQNVSHRWNHHFRVPIDEGRRLMDSLSGDLSGIALPQYVVYLPRAGGKVSLISDKVVNRTERGWVIRNHKGVESFYYDPVNSLR